MTFILSFPMAHPCWVLAGGFLSSHVGVGYGQTGPVEHLGWGLGWVQALCVVSRCAQMWGSPSHIPHVSWPWDQQEVGGKVRATCRYQVWVSWHLWAAAQRWGMLILGKSSSSTQMQVGLPLFSCQGLQGPSSCGGLPAPGAQFGLQLGSSVRN